MYFFKFKLCQYFQLLNTSVYFTNTILTIRQNKNKINKLIIIELYYGYRLLIVRFYIQISIFIFFYIVMM